MQLYFVAARDVRVGMDAVLISTLSPSDANAVMDVYSEHLPTHGDRQRMFESLTILDHEATKVRGDIEAHKRKIAMEMAEKSKSGRVR